MWCIHKRHNPQYNSRDCNWRRNRGVAVLSCTDCGSNSASSTASSDITSISSGEEEPGSPFSTASTNSEDSGTGGGGSLGGGGGRRMPPTQSAPHPSWPWTGLLNDPPPEQITHKRSLPATTVSSFAKRLKQAEAAADRDNNNCSKSRKTPQLSTGNKMTVTVTVTADPAKKQATNGGTTTPATAPTAVPTVVPATGGGGIAPTGAHAKRQLARLASVAVKADCSPMEKLAKLKKSNAMAIATAAAAAALTQDGVPKMQQGKITEYFKSQISKSNGIKKDLLNRLKKPMVGKLVDQQTQFNSLKAQCQRKESKPSQKKMAASKAKKITTVPRKILPAPANGQDKMAINEHTLNNLKFTPTVTLTALSFPAQNYAYLHPAAAKTPTAQPYVQQFTAITNDKIPIPIINRTPCLNGLNVIQPVQKIATINNFNCVKLNTVVPIVKVNALPIAIGTPVPPQQAAPPPSLPAVALSVETALPTVLPAKPRVPEASVPLVSQTTPATPVQPISNVLLCSRTTEPQECQVQTELREQQQEIREDKSPSDSDSGISSNRECLEVNVDLDSSSLEAEQKSPILSQPKTIRFPCKRDQKEEGKSPQHSTDGRCRWEKCDQRLDTSGALLEHLQVQHVISQTDKEHYVCLWLGCKVHGRTSCSRSWLERHVLAHAGTKPFRCIVDGCGQRFNSQLMLERHVNNHFNQDGSPNTSARKTTENGCCKLFKRNGKKIRFRRQPWSARMFDFIDSGIMEGLQHNLLMLTQKRTAGKISEAPGDEVQLHSTVLARRTDADGSVKYLLRWHPEDVVPDEWVSESAYKPSKSVSIPSLSPTSKVALKPVLFPSTKDEEPRRKQQRKQPKRQT
ncbi:unnamed protein product [Acanthoscelides obtectus]|uniref:C2H2-type domain-containing protein n=1 Tax=Acanthoscelides obtectus TaxID=200917 RepID=A0A9P0P4P5_ACAOB|nr:unnamed protein product [Acanthoscelides obtectus]CAK1645764.1 Zinc finger protein jing homolog [Acanthoscelides obtectus]